jgi:anti-sigma regulatory factor (Ser/Thr protein kinase)
VPAAQHEQFDHVAVFHQGPEGLAAQLAGWLPASIGPADAVLLSLDGRSSAVVGALLADHPAPVTSLPTHQQYQRPAAAVRALHDFARRATADGASRVWCIGRIDFATEDDGRWARYEAAVDDVLSHLPLVGVCAYDTAALPDSAIDTARRTHRHVHDAHGWRASADYLPRALSSPATWWIPTTTPATVFPAGRHAAGRAAVADVAAAAGCPADRLIDLQIMTSELATNAVLHGTPPATVRVWHGEGRIVVQVSDHGPGLADAWPDLRPPAGHGIGGLGLWLVGQLADRFHIGRRGGTTVVTAAVELA